MSRVIGLNEAKGLVEFAQQFKVFNELLQNPKLLPKLITELTGVDETLAQEKELLALKYTLSTLQGELSAKESLLAEKNLTVIKQENDLAVKLKKFHDDSDELKKSLKDFALAQKQLLQETSLNEKIKLEINEKAMELNNLIKGNEDKQVLLDNLINEYNKKLETLKSL